MPSNVDIQWLKNEWQNLTHLYPDKADTWFSFIVSKYSEKHRYYHNLTHIQTLLQYTNQYASQLKNIQAVKWAVWFHDIIYDPQSKENEVKSNEVWLSFAQETENIDKTTLNLVQSMIVGSTTHSLENLPKSILLENDQDILYFFDFDLSILSSEPEEYQNYAEAIRKEYAYAPDELYKQGRIIVLERFLSRKIYHSPVFSLLEAKAKNNIQSELMKLKSL